MSDDEPDVLADGESEAEGNGECFVIAPIGSENSETRKQTNGLLDEAIRPTVEKKLDLEVIAPHEIANPGSIPNQVIQRLLEADLVVADLTNLNPNVMYELAVRHAKGKPVVPIAEKETSLPFDIMTERTVFYEDSMHGLKELKPKLKNAGEAALQDEKPSNPIHRAQQDFAMREAAADETMIYILNRLNDIEKTVSRSFSGRAISPIGSAPVVKEPVYVIEGPEDQLDELVEMVSSELSDAGVSLHEVMPTDNTGEDTYGLSVRHSSMTSLVNSIVEDVVGRLDRFTYRGVRSE